jgi:dCMP deaminase
VIYLSDKYEQTDAAKASRMMLDKAGIRYRKVETRMGQIVLSFNEEKV